MAALCYAAATNEDNHTNSANQPLLDNEKSGLEDVRQSSERRNNNNERLLAGSRYVVIGTFIGLLMQVVTFGSFEILIRRWGKYPRLESGHDYVFYGIFMCLSECNIVLGILVYIGLVASFTKRGSLYIRKKFDLSEGPKSVSVQTVSLSCFSGIALGSLMGCFAVSVIYGIPGVVLMPLFEMVVLDFVVFFVLFRACAWRNDSGDDDNDNDNGSSVENQAPWLV
jgi:uncharacterized membrane protein